MSKCDKGFYSDLTEKRCVLCQSDCASCSGPNYCDECPKDYFLVEVDPENLNHGRCVAKCPEEFKEDTSKWRFLDLILGRLVKICLFLGDKNVRKCVTVCGDNCLDCEKSLCRRCKENYYLTADHRCVNSCGEGYFQDNVKRECAE